MKTFEEACRGTFVYPSNSKAEDAAAAKAITELQARWAPMIEEIRRSSLTKLYIRGVIGHVAADVIEPDDAFLSVFVSGIIIGSEMYRAEGGIAAESVPGRREKGPSSSPGEPPPTGWTSI